MSPDSPTRLSRRRFLHYSLRGSLLVLAGYLLSVLGLRFRDRELFPAQIVRQRLRYLQLPPQAELERFSKHYLESIGAQREKLVLELATFAPLYALLKRIGIRSKLAQLLPEVEEHVCFIFLMSTNFFAQGAKEELPLQYGLLYNPHRYPCQNPFAQFAPRAV